VVRNSKRIVVGGAGPGGLASAMLLARAGFQVTVLERLERVGGRTSTLHADVEGLGRFNFDMGPTFFLYPRIVREIFHACGRDFDREVPMTRLDPQYRLIFDGEASVDCTADLDRMKRELAKLNPDDAAGLERYLADNRAKLDAFRPILESPFLSLRDTVGLPLLKLLRHVRPWASVERDLRRYFSDERTRLAFSFQSKYLGMSPFNCPSLFTILAFLEYENGVWHPEGGCGAVSRAMARAAVDMGVDLRLNEPVRSLDFDGRRVTAALTDAGRYDADALIINADFAHAMTNLVPDRLRRRWSDAKLARKKYSCSTFMLYLGVEGTFDNVPHHTIYLSGDYRANLADIETRHRLSDDPSFYVQNASVTDPTLAPEGHSTIYGLIPVSHQHDNIDWASEAPRCRDLFLDRMAKVGLPDLRSRIRYEKLYTPDDWQSGMNIHRGATFNLAHSLDQMLHLRPRNRFEDLEGVYLVGGGTHPGSGLPVIYESSRITSRLVMRDFGLDEAWVPGAEIDRKSTAPRSNAPVPASTEPAPSPAAAASPRPWVDAADADAPLVESGR